MRISRYLDRLSAGGRAGATWRLPAIRLPAISLSAIRLSVPRPAAIPRQAPGAQAWIVCPLIPLPPSRASLRRRARRCKVGLAAALFAGLCLLAALDGARTSPISDLVAATRGVAGSATATVPRQRPVPGPSDMIRNGPPPRPAAGLVQRISLRGRSPSCRAGAEWPLSADGTVPAGAPCGGGIGAAGIGQAVPGGLGAGCCVDCPDQPGRATIWRGAFRLLSASCCRSGPPGAAWCRRSGPPAAPPWSRW